MWPCSWFKKRLKQKRLEMYKRFRDEDDNRVIKYSNLMPEHGLDPEFEKQQMEKERAMVEESILRGSIPITGSPYKKSEAKPPPGAPKPWSPDCYHVVATETGRFSAKTPNESAKPQEVGTDFYDAVVAAAILDKVIPDDDKLGSEDNNDRFVPAEEDWKPIEVKLEEVDIPVHLEDTSSDWSAINQEIEDNTTSVDEPEQGGYDTEEQGGYDDESSSYDSGDDD